MRRGPVFGRRTRDQEEAAREAERRAVFAELAKRPDTVCPFLGLASSRTGYQESVSDEHRCYAFGDPAELSAEQQQKVCLQPGYGNCPRYLRGVLVIPTEELEALRHPAPVPARPAAAAAAKPATTRRGWGRVAFVGLVLLLLVGGIGGASFWYLRNQVPSSAVSAALPDGTDLSAELISLSEPDGNTQRLQATAAIGAAQSTATTTLVYVLDVSRTTRRSNGCGGDQNSDGRADTVLDCEIASAARLNAEAITNGQVTAVGLVGFAEGAVTGDLAPDAGPQDLIGPEVDHDGDQTPNVVEAMQSAFSAISPSAPVGFRVFSEVITRSPTTDFSAGIAATCQVLASAETENRVVVFLSDGLNLTGQHVSEVLPCSEGAVFHSFAVGTEANCSDEPEVGGLATIAELTNGTCTDVPDLTQLPEILEDVVSPQILRMELSVDGGDPIDISHASSPQPPQPGPETLTIAYPIPALTPGEHRLCMTVFASDAGGAGEVETCSTVDAGGGRLTSN
ncbi:MAG TPA: hypothetical protein VF114_08480 [Candidatus Limnocylindria bacterium]